MHPSAEFREGGHVSLELCALRDVGNTRVDEKSRVPSLNHGRFAGRFSYGECFHHHIKEGEGRERERERERERGRGRERRYNTIFVLVTCYNS